MDALSCLLEARAGGVPCPPVRGLLPAKDIAAAYAVQAAWVAADGSPVVGRKVGLTNPAVQAQLGVDRPDFGTLLAWMDRSGEAPIDAGSLLQPRIEAEIAFVLGENLDGGDVGPEAVAAATVAVAPALEIVDSRIAGWDIDIVDTVADNASSGLFVLGAARVPLAGLDLPACTMAMARDGSVVSTGTGAACLGNPLDAVAWLAATARDLGRPLLAGEIVLSGALGPMVPVAAGERYEATITGLGTVAAVFT
ncbi:2-keto-4-pentenoate hydratase [Dactylosporangium sp. CS-047395]|uniref:2-keto-4-pentenoate hydratase n=1 Tax=Dactylosporangium sp. CS-047395 TaxID=3239936 RepID=UPI003D912D5A